MDGTSEAHQNRLILLRERHQALDDEIDATSKRRWLTPVESRLLKELKVKRLRLRDAIRRLELEVT